MHRSTRNAIAFFVPLALAVVASLALAAPPWNLTASFDAPITGGAPTGYNVYLDDCAATGATGAPIGTISVGTTGTFDSVLTDERTYQVCVRAFNDAGEQPDPNEAGPGEGRGDLTPTNVPIPGGVRNLNVTCSASTEAVTCVFTGN